LLFLFSKTLQIRRNDEVDAMAWSQRVRTRVKNLLTRPDHEDNGDAAEDVESKGRRIRQYRLDGSRGRATGRPSFIRRIITLNGCIPTPGMNNVSSEGNNQSLAAFLHWMFRVNFVMLFILMSILFFVLVLGFSSLITLAGTMDPECIRVGNASFGSSGAPFADGKRHGLVPTVGFRLPSLFLITVACFPHPISNLISAFALSWTTMASVSI
jgi:hypothetical protein